MQGLLSRQDYDNIERLCQLIWENKIPVEQKGVLNKEWEQFFIKNPETIENPNPIPEPTSSLVRIINQQNSRGQTPCYLICRTANLELLKLVISCIDLAQTLVSDNKSIHLSNILHGLFWEYNGKKEMIDIVTMFYYLLDLVPELTLKLLVQHDFKGESPLLLLNQLLWTIKIPCKQTLDHYTASSLKNICGQYFNVYKILDCYMPLNEILFIHNIITKDCTYFVERLEYYFKEDKTLIQYIIDDFNKIKADDGIKLYRSHSDFIHCLDHSKKLLKIIKKTPIYIFFNALENDNNMIYPSEKFLEIRNYMNQNKEFYLKEGWEILKTCNLITI
jgi:hypothetical protein